jgi:Pregnancy-associated plasma protein-A
MMPMHRTCGTMEVHNRLLELYPEYRASLGRLEMATRERIAARTALPTQEVTIPVVVHVVYRTNVENISDQQVQSEIEALNKDYGATNPDKSNVPAVWSNLVSDTMIRFALAKTDPNGTLTSGITRTQTTVISFSQDNSVKSSASGGADAWPSDKYLDLWACALGGGLLGYAQFPGGPAATDGVVILNTAIGNMGTATAPFNLGRTATHEIGHWLNLRHIWGDTEDCTGTDLVDDTPNAQLPNYGKPTFPHVSCNNSPNGDMFMNYMDYVDDAAMVMFTNGQIARMHATLAGPRSSILATAQALTS